MFRRIIILFCLFIPFIGFTQIDYLIKDSHYNDYSDKDKHLVDSILSDYHSKEDVLDKFAILEVLCDNLWHEDWVNYNEFMLSGLESIKQNSLSQDEKNILLGLLSNSYNNKGYAVMHKGEMIKSLEYYQKAYDLAIESGERNRVGTTLNNMGYVYEHIGDVERATEKILESIRVREELNEYDGLDAAYINLGFIYYSQHDLDKAEEYFIKGLETTEKSGDLAGRATAINNLGKIYDQRGDNDKALEYFEKSMKIKEDLGNKPSLVLTLINIAQIRFEVGDEAEAFETLKKGMQIAEEIEFIEGIWGLKYQYGVYYKEKGMISQAMQMAEECHELALKLNFPDNVKLSVLLLSELNEMQGNYKVAYQLHKEYSSLKDSIENQAIRESTLKKEMQYEFEKKEIAYQKEQEKRDLLAEQESLRQRNFIAYIFVALLGLIVFTVSLYNRFKLTSQQKQIIEEQKILVEEKNEEIESSINYAKRIQEAILPPRSLVQSFLKDSFILYLPKDIVAGDFYFFEEKGDEVYFASADCTGHGVPGAMVSVVCSNALKRAVREMNLTEPGEILDKVREMVVETFESSEHDVKDGMDIALCRLNLKTKELVYSGAHNPLYVVSRQSTVDIQESEESGNRIITHNGFILNEYKADKMPIGKHRTMKAFNQHNMKLNAGDTLYISSDGYADQFGGPKGRKFMYKPFKQLLLELQNNSLPEQAETLLAKFDEWKGEMEQVDDVCVIGVRIG